MNAWLTPNSIPSDRLCLSLLVPNSLEFIMIIRGCLGLLTKPENFQQFGTLTAAETADIFQSVYFDFIYQSNMECYMIGAILMYPNNTIPTKCLPCDGSTYNRSDYPLLYTALAGTLYIVDADTFTTPDMRGVFPLGADGAHPNGSTGGTNQVNIGVQHLPAHTHDYQGVLMNVDIEGVGVPDVTAAGINPLAQQTSSVGGGQALDITPPYRAVNFVIIAK